MAATRGGEQDGDEAADDRHDVEQAHQYAEQDGVADVQGMEDDRAGDAENDHQGELTDEPFAHAAFGGDQRARKAVARLKRDERQEVEVGELAFQHEVDAEDAGRDDVQDADRSTWVRRRTTIGCGGGGEVLDLFTDGLSRPRLSAKGRCRSLSAIDRQPLGKIRREVLDIVKNGRHREDEEESRAARKTAITRPSTATVREGCRPKMRSFMTCCTMGISTTAKSALT